MTSTGWLALAVFLILAAIVLHAALLFIAGIVLLLRAATVATWGRYCLDRLEYNRSFSVRRAFCGKEIEYGIRLVNRKLLPLAWVSVDDEIPLELTLSGVELSPSHKPLRAVLSNLFALGWYEAVSRRYRLQCNHRGYHSFGPATLRSGDIFGFTLRQEDLPCEDRLLIYPRVVPLAELGIPSRQLFGDLAIRRPIAQDPLRVIGVREYAAGDSLRRVHWMATARTGRLQVKQLESTTSRDLLIFLNITTFEPAWQGVVPGLLELAIIAAAAIANEALEKGEPIGLYANTTLPGSDQPAKVVAGDGPEQLMLVLEALAKLGGFTTVPMHRFLEQEARSLSWSATLLVVTAVLSDQLLGTLVHLQRAGRKLGLILVGSDIASVRLPGIPVYRVGETRLWAEAQTLELQAVTR